MKLFKALPAWAAALAMLFAPALALAQADATNTIPGGLIYEATGRFGQSITPVIQVGQDSSTGKLCLVGHRRLLCSGAGNGWRRRHVLALAVRARQRQQPGRPVRHQLHGGHCAPGDGWGHAGDHQSSELCRLPEVRHFGRHRSYFG
jgi:hypothetical protein